MAGAKTCLPRGAKLAGEAGQTVVEWALLYGTVLMPLLFAIIFTSELLWMWHSVVDFTRQGAQYAATHCWQASGENVLTYMRGHIPPMVDSDQLLNGPAEISIQYFARNPEDGSLTDFACDQGECSTGCIPDVVTVRVANYEFRRFLSFLGLPGVPIPDFRTTAPMESAGCDPEQGACLP